MDWTVLVCVWLSSSFVTAGSDRALAASRCTGGSCGSCLACAVPGASLLLLGMLGTLVRRRKEQPASSPVAAGDDHAFDPVEGHSSP